MKPNSGLSLAVALALGSPVLSAPALPSAPPSISIAPLSSVVTGDFDESASEIGAYDPVTRRLFVVNAQAALVDVIDIADPAAPVLRRDLSIDVTPHGAVANSVAVNNGIIAIAVEADPKTDPGTVVFYDTAAQFLGSVTVGALPDMLTFTPNGRYVLVANEGEPDDDYTNDPEGSVSVIDLGGGVGAATVRTAGFTAFNAFSPAELFYGTGGAKPAIRIFGPGATVSQDIEPEYITVSHDSKTAWVTLQENNAIAILDIPTATITGISGLGVKDHSLPGNGLDPSNEDGGIKIATAPVQGLFLPDGIASFKAGNQTYLVVANEGDSRDYDGYSEEERIKDLDLDPVAFPNASDLQKKSKLGRLKVTTAQGDPDGDGDFDELYSYGARSFSIRTATGAMVWDSGDAFEQITALAEGSFFNASNDNNTFDDRSDDKGPEPEGVTVAKIHGRNYAFIGLERVGGVMVYDVSKPTAPEFVQYLNNRDFTQDPESLAAGDLGPEGLLVIAGEDSPNGLPLLVVTSEVSGTTTIYAINKVK